MYNNNNNDGGDGDVDNEKNTLPQFKSFNCLQTEKRVRLEHSEISFIYK